MLVLTSLLQIPMNVMKTMGDAVKFALTHLVAINVLVTVAMYWILMVLIVQVNGSYL